MKKLLFLICVLIHMNNCYAQSNTSTKQGLEKISIKNKRDLTGTWTANNGEFKINISVERKDLNTPIMNVNAEYLVIKMEKYLYNGNDISSQFNTFELASLANNNSYYGLLGDPVTENEMRITMTFINKDNFQFRARLPEMDVFHDVRKGTVFPKKPIIFKKLVD